MRILAAFSLLAFSMAAAAHHSRSHYSQDVVELEGELVAVHWVNPHVGFTVRVVNDDGEAELWRVEGISNLVGMQRGGVDAEEFTIGERVRALGSPSLRRPRDLLTTNLLLADGREILLSRSADPYWSDGDVGGAPSALENRVVDAASENRGIFRVWSALPDGAGQRTHFPFTAAAVAARAAWDPINNFAERCEPEGMPRIMRNPHPFEFVDNGAEISLISQLYDLVRTIHMDGTAPAADAPASPLGYSVGRWEDDTLLVETTRINWPYFDNIGTPQSDDVHMLETFTVSEDQTRLDYRLTVTDPHTFSAPAVLERQWLALGESIVPYDCQVY